MTASPTLDLTPQRAEALIRLLTDGLVNIEDTTGEFLLHRESPSPCLALPAGHTCRS
jgi:hypothetical protein